MHRWRHAGWSRPTRGVVPRLVYGDYDKEKTVVMNPEDSQWLAAIGEPSEDPAAIKALLGLP